METFNPSAITIRPKGSYPTYEEWKLVDGVIAEKYGFGSYPTYEEWKLSIPAFSDGELPGFLSYL